MGLDVTLSDGVVSQGVSSRWVGQRAATACEEGVGTMLVLRRKAGEAIVLNGVITIHVLAVEGERVKLGISAPPEVVIVRSELLEGPGAGMGMPGGAAQGGPMAPHREPRPYREPERPYREPERPYREPERPYREPERPYREPERPYREPDLSRENTRGPDEGGEESRRGQGMPQEPNRYSYGERPRPFGYGERPRPFGERNLPTSIGSGPLHRE